MLLQLRIFKSLFFSYLSHTSTAVLSFSSVNPHSQLFPQSLPAMPTYTGFSLFLFFMVHHIQTNGGQGFLCSHPSAVEVAVVSRASGHSMPHHFSSFLWGHPIEMLKTCLGHQGQKCAYFGNTNFLFETNIKKRLNERA